MNSVAISRAEEGRKRDEQSMTFHARHTSVGQRRHGDPVLYSHCVVRRKKLAYYCHRAGYHGSDGD